MSNKKMSRKKSKKSFTKRAVRSHRYNTAIASGAPRGGWRLS